MLPARPKYLRQLLFTALCLCSPVVTAQEAETAPKPIITLGTRPFVVITAAGVNRVRDKAQCIFEAAGMPEAVESIMEKLEENVGGLKGLNWDRPAGMMVYLNSVFPPSFEFVSFLPMSDLEQFQSLMELGTVVMQKDAEQENRYELITPRRNIQIRVQGDYAFIQMPIMEPDPTFDRDLPDPQTLVAGLTNQFDIAVSLDVEAVPKATRDLILNLLTATMSTQIQQRDAEPESQYQIRKSWLQADIDAFKLLMDECRRISVGISVNDQESTANLDVLVEVREATQLLEEIFASATKPSYFTPILSETSPLSLSWSAVLSERDRERYEGVLEGLKGEIARGIEEQDLGTVPQQGSPLFLALEALQATVREGHLDTFGQMYRDSDNKLVVAGAMRLEDGDSVAAGFQDLLVRLQGQDAFGEIETGFGQHAGVTFHRLKFKNPDAGAIELLGTNPGITIGIGPRSVWGCVGGDESFDTLKGVMDELSAAYENPVERQAPASMRLILKINELIAMVQGAEAAKKEASADKEKVATEIAAAAAPLTEDQQRARAVADRRQEWRQRRDQNNQIMRDALAEGNDEIRVEARPIDNGMRVRARFDEGFLRGLGRIIGSRFMAEK